MYAQTQFNYPIVKIYSFSTGQQKYEFNPNSNNAESKTLINLNYSQAINVFSGTFSFSVKDIGKKTGIENKYLIDTIDYLDVVCISTCDEQILFIGVVTDITFNAIASGMQRITTISGKSIGYLFEYMTVYLNAAIMASGKAANVDILNLGTKFNLGQGQNPIKVSVALNDAYREFVSTNKDNLSGLSNTSIDTIIKQWFGVNPFDVATSGMTFKYPITKNLYDGGTVSFYSFMQGLLPQPVYEFHDSINELGQPKIKVREVPFKELNWSKLPKTNIEGIELTEYNIQKSINECYTHFFPYLENSSFSPNWIISKESIENGKIGNGIIQSIPEKIPLHGVKLLQCNFIGFSSNQNANIEDNFKKLSQDLAEMYGNIEYMYKGRFTIIDRRNKQKAKIGSKLGIGTTSMGSQIEFYVVGIDYNWQYLGNGMITYHCERGGYYSALGKFSPIKNMSRSLFELEK